MKIKGLVVAVLLFPLGLLAQDRFVVSGYVKDAINGEDLIAANVFILELGVGATSNSYGFYSLNIPAGSYSIRYSYTGFYDTIVKVKVSSNLTIDMNMRSSQRTLATAEVVSKKGSENVSSTEMGTAKLNIATIQKIPALLGEVDLVRSIQLLPGVTTVGEGATGFNVRGGGIDQNLVLLDEAPVFNSSHLFGFFSVFNPDAVKDVKLTKGGIPSIYGGRLSSILDVRMKDGNNKNFQTSGGVGLIFSRLAIEGPIVKDKGSFVVAGRRSYIDVVAKPFLPDGLSGSQFYFYDLTAKVNYTINKKNKIYLSGYIGRDVFAVPDAFGFDWGNQTATLRWNSLLNTRLFSNTTAYFSKYDYKLMFGGETDGFQWKSNIMNYSLKQEFTYFASPKRTMNFGGQSIFYTFVPGTTTIKQNDFDIEASLPDKYSLENALFIDVEEELNPRLKIRYGLRFSNFNYLGRGTAFYYGDTVPNNRKPLLTSESFDRFERIATYNNFEPRLSINYMLNDKQSIKASYNRMAQYLHLISNTTASVPLDVWTPSTNNIPGQLADQYALGYFHNFKKNAYETSVEVYYKDFKNQVDYIDGADLLLNEQLEGELLVGIGRAYGAEFYVKKNEGKLTGWISYTLARSERQVEGINNNEWYPVRFDRAHNLNVVAIYQFSERLSISGNFLYYTGTPATFFSNKASFQTITIPHIDQNQRNNYRIPAYHRADISLTLDSKKTKKYESSWVFSVYNIYQRRNPFSIYFQPVAGQSGANEAIRFAVLGSAVPAVTYNFKF